jgi:hypothetical protein
MVEIERSFVVKGETPICSEIRACVNVSAYLANIQWAASTRELIYTQHVI